MTGVVAISSFVFGSEYCIQVASAPLGNERLLIKKAQMYRDYPSVRVERRGAFMSLRIGRFHRYAQARRILDRIQRRTPDAFVRNCEWRPSLIVFPSKKNDYSNRTDTAYPAPPPSLSHAFGEERGVYDAQVGRGREEERTYAPMPQRAPAYQESYRSHQSMYPPQGRYRQRPVVQEPPLPREPAQPYASQEELFCPVECLGLGRTGSAIMQGSPYRHDLVEVDRSSRSDRRPREKIPNTQDIERSRSVPHQTKPPREHSRSEQTPLFDYAKFYDTKINEDEKKRKTPKVLLQKKSDQKSDFWYEVIKKTQPNRGQ